MHPLPLYVPCCRALSLLDLAPCDQFAALQRQQQQRQRQRRQQHSAAASLGGWEQHARAALSWHPPSSSSSSSRRRRTVSTDDCKLLVQPAPWQANQRHVNKSQHLHCTAPHRTASHCTAPHRTAPHRTAPHRTALHCTALHCVTRPCFTGWRPMGHPTCAHPHMHVCNWSGPVSCQAHQCPVNKALLPPLYCNVRHSAVLYGTVRYSTVRYGVMRCGTVLYGTVPYGTVLYGTVPYGEMVCSTESREGNGAPTLRSSSSLLKLWHFLHSQASRPSCPSCRQQHNTIRHSATHYNTLSDNILLLFVAFAR